MSWHCRHPLQAAALQRQPRARQPACRPCAWGGSLCRPPLALVLPLQLRQSLSQRVAPHGPALWLLWPPKQAVAQRPAARARCMGWCAAGCCRLLLIGRR